MQDIMELVHEDVLEGRDLRIVVKAEEELSQVNTMSCKLCPVLCLELCPELSPVLCAVICPELCPVNYVLHNL